MPPAQFARQTIRLQFDKDVHFGDDASIILAKAGGDVIDTITLRVDWPADMSSNVQYSTGTAMIDRVELLYKDQIIERHYGESMYILGDVSVPEAKQSGLSNLVGTHTTSNLATYFIQFPFSIKLPICALDEPPTIRIIFQPSSYFSDVTYTQPVNMSLYVNYVYVSAAERKYLKETQLSYPTRTFQRTQFRIPYTFTEFSFDTSFVNMVKEIFWVLQLDQYSSNVYDYSDSLVSVRLMLDGEERISNDIGTGHYLTVKNRHTRAPSGKYYSYSFELDPESDQENGAVNMSAVTRQRHVMTLTPQTLWRSLRVYAHSYNIFCVEKGNGRTVYPMLEAGYTTIDTDIPYVVPPAPPLPLYIFERTFIPAETLLYYGQSLAINNTGTAMIISAAGTGIVVIYKNNGIEWDTGTQIVSPYAIGAYFGYAVDISDDGNTIVVGAPAAQRVGGQGTATVYVCTAGVWDTGTDLPTTVANTTHGWAVAIDSAGTTVVVGAPNANGNAGYACVYIYSGGSWGSEIPLTNTATSLTARFGLSVSIAADGLTAVVGAPQGRYAAVYSSPTWSTPTVLTTGLSLSANFGQCVYISPDGTKIIVGVPSNESAFVYTYTAGTWGTGVGLTSTAASGSEFGTIVTLSGDGTVAVVSAPLVNYVAAYVYTAGVWGAANILSDETGDSNSRFGSAVSISHDASKVLVGATLYDDDTGYAALYQTT